MTILTPGAHRVLTALQTDSDIDSLASALSLDTTTLQQTLVQLTDVGLVTGADGDTFDLTPSGRRVLARYYGGSADDSYDLDPAVLRTIDTFRLPPDREAAIRAAYLFLKYWGDATRCEIKDAVYREHPAGYESPAEWWNDYVGEYLAALPNITRPDAEDVWRYTGSSVREHATDGRHVSKTYGSVRHAIEHLTQIGPRRTAVRAAFARLYSRERCAKRDFVESVFPEYPAGYDSADAWWNRCISPAFEQLPRVERIPEADTTWRYSFDSLTKTSGER